MKRRVAYVATSAPTDRATWSGSTYHIARCLGDHVGPLEWIGPLRQQHKLALRARQIMSMMLAGRWRLLDREPIVLKGYARQAAALIAGLNVDFVFSPSTLPVAHLECRQPIFFWTDATFAAMLGFYLNRDVITDNCIRDANAAERAALERCRLAIYSSDWAARSAIDHYGVDSKKVKVLPFGANLETERTFEQIRAMIASRPGDRCRLLFVGVDWIRKGGDIALAVAQRLNEEGLRTELTVVGCEPKIDRTMPTFVRPIGYLKKTTAEGRSSLESLYAESHFLILPSRAETFGLVLAEACAFGLPCVASSVGGIPTIVRNGLNGMTFDMTNIEAVCKYVEGLMADRRRYEQLALSAFDEYEKRLNWDVAGKTIRTLIEEYL